MLTIPLPCSPPLPREVQLPHRNPQFDYAALHMTLLHATDYQSTRLRLPPQGRGIGASHALRLLAPAAVLPKKSRSEVHTRFTKLLMNTAHSRQCSRVQHPRKGLPTRRATPCPKPRSTCTPSACLLVRRLRLRVGSNDGLPPILEMLGDSDMLTRLVHRAC